jgi:hypothetical protein
LLKVKVCRQRGQVTWTVLSGTLPAGISRLKLQVGQVMVTVGMRDSPVGVDVSGRQGGGMSDG